MSTATNDRAVSTANAAQLTASLTRPVFLVSLAFSSETVYVTTSGGNITWGGNTYLGVGQLGSISPIVEGSDVSAQGIVLTLSGIPANLLNDSMGELQAGTLAQVYLGFVDVNGALVDDPIPAFIGMLDQPNIDLDTSDPENPTATITVSVENRLADLNRQRGGRYTDQDQRARYAQDGSLKYVHFLQDERISWQ